MLDFNNKKYYLFDGAMGTYYYAVTGNSKSCEEANLTDRDTIIKIHKEYILAGADAIKTNTFSANPYNMSNYRKVIQAACENARIAAEGTTTDIFADIGPVKGIDDEEAITALCKAADVFFEQGINRFLIETFDSLYKAKAVAEYIHNKDNAAVTLLSFGIDQDGHTKQGNSARAITDDLSTVDYITGFGFNCVCGPAHMRSVIRELDLEGKTITVMPNAGYPSAMNGRIIYNDNPLYFAKTVAELNSYGVKILGGCCGTTPNHIKSVKEALDNNRFITPTVVKAKDKSVAKKQKNIIKDKLTSGNKVLIAELDPPFDVDFEYMHRASTMAKDAGADAISVTDSPLARARASSMIIASKIKREVGIDAIAHITCRDKNRIGMKSALLGLYMESIRNVLVITGDPVPASDRETTGSVYQLNSYELSGYITALNRDVFTNDPIYLSGALNPGAVNFDAELKRAQRKMENGVRYFVTQPVFSTDAIANIKKAKSVLNAPVIIGIMPIASYKNAVFLNNEVTGVNIPENIVESFYEKSREEAAKISIDFAMDTAKKYYDIADGFMIMTQLKRIDLTCSVIQKLKELEGENR